MIPGDHGEVAVVFEFNEDNKEIKILEYAPAKIPSFSAAGKRQAYLSQAIKYVDSSEDDRNLVESYFTSQAGLDNETTDESKVKSEPPDPNTAAVYVGKKKYKPVAKKVNAVPAFLPAKFRIERHILGDPLADMPALSPHPPDFVPTGR